MVSQDRKAPIMNSLQVPLTQVADTLEQILAARFFYSHATTLTSNIWPIPISAPINGRFTRILDADIGDAKCITRPVDDLPRLRDSPATLS